MKELKLEAKRLESRYTKTNCCPSVDCESIACNPCANLSSCCCGC
ncbi:MAG: hypothetical protein SVJ22_06510 [Halobacteriota archaeon]|nr:hypothetical protein [Halobacteriota archaeon]